MAWCTVPEQQKQPLSSYHWDDKIQPIVTSVVSCDSSVLRTGGMEIMGDQFLMYNISQPDLFSYYRLRNDSLIFSAQVQKRGRGPYEALSGRAVFMPDCNALFLIDQQTRQSAFRIDMSNQNNLVDLSTWKIFSLPTSQSSMSIIPTGCDGTFIAQTMEDREHMFGRFSASDSTVTPIVLPYPETGVACPDISLGLVFAGTLQKRPGSQEYVFSAQNSRYVMIFTLSENDVSDIRLLYDTPPQFTLAEDGINVRISGDTPSGFYVHATKRYIYLTPRNHRESDRKILKNQPVFGSAYETFVFDWEGMPIKKILTDQPVKSVTITDDDRFLYAKHTDSLTFDEFIVSGKLQ